MEVCLWSTVTLWAVVMLACFSVCRTAPITRSAAQSDESANHLAPSESHGFQHMKTQSMNQSSLLNESSSYDVLSTQLAVTSASNSSYQIVSSLEESAGNVNVSDAKNPTQTETVAMTTKLFINMDDDDDDDNDDDIHLSSTVTSDVMSETESYSSGAESMISSASVSMTTPRDVDLSSSSSLSSPSTTMSSVTFTTSDRKLPLSASPSTLMMTTAPTNEPLIDHAINDITAMPSTHEKKPFAKTTSTHSSPVLTTVISTPSAENVTNWSSNESHAGTVTENGESFPSATTNSIDANYTTTTTPTVLSTNSTSHTTPVPPVVEWPAVKKPNYTLSGEARKPKKTSANVIIKPPKNGTILDNWVPLPTSTTMARAATTTSSRLTSTTTIRWQPPLYIIVTVTLSPNKLCEVLPALKKFLASSISDRVSRVVANQHVVFINTQWCDQPQNALMVVEHRSSFTALAFYIVDVKDAYDRTTTNEFAVMLLEDGGFAHSPSSPMIDIIVDFKIHGEVNMSKPTSLPTSETPSKIPSGTNNGVFIAVTVSSIAAVCIVTMVAVKVMLNRRKKCRRRMRKSFVRHQVDISAITNDTLHLGDIGIKVTADMFVYDNPTLQDFGYSLHSGPLDLSALKQVTGDKEAMEDEFLMLPNKLAQLSDIPPGAEDKNRYANVIPYAETRVPLSLIEGEENSDYINANYIEGYLTNRAAYITTQAPLEETKNDFWRMVWQEGSRVIIMLTGLEEQGHVKCCEYWPHSESGSSVVIYGNYEVILEKVEVRHDWIMSELSITDITTNERRVLRHFWLTAWPINDLPHIPTVIHFMLMLRTYLDETTAPAVVHCSSGTGRSGTLIAVELCMQSYDDVGTVDVAGVVRKLRQQRCGMVQTRQQFIYVYTVLYEYAKMVEEAKKATAEKTSK